MPPANNKLTTNQQIRLAEEQLRRYEDLVENVTSTRAQFLRELTDPRRDIFHECGYPKVLTPRDYQRSYDRNPFAARLCELMPKEALKTPLTVYESEEEDVTPFEEDVDSLGSQLQGTKSWHKDEEGSVFWSIIEQAAIQASIGQYGVVLFGLNDGMELSQPVVGVEEEGSLPGVTAKRTPLDPNGNPVSEAGVVSYEGLGAWKDPYKDTVELKRNEAGEVVELPREFRPYRLTVNRDKIQKSITVNAETKKPELKEAERKLGYLRCFPEAQAMVTRWEMNRYSPRFGQPVSYLITFDSGWDGGGSYIGQPTTSLDVHWTRVVHVPGRIPGPNPVLSQPEQQAVFNNLMNLEKIFASDGEGVWKSGFPTLIIKTHPQLGTAAKVDKPGLKNQIENLENSLTKVLVLMGLDASTLPPQVIDLTPHVDKNVEAICVRVGVPVPVFKGYEIGEQASENNDENWDDTVQHYQKTYLIPKVVVPVIDRLIMVGVLTEPKEYHVDTPSRGELSPEKRANVAATLTTAMAGAISGGVIGTFCTEKRYLTDVIKLTEEEADAWIEELEEQQEQQLAEGDVDEFGNPLTPGAQLQQQQPPPFGEEGAPPAEDDEEEGEPPAVPFVDNAFCPTGKGGGIDNSCSPKTVKESSSDALDGEIYKVNVKGRGLMYAVRDVIDHPSGFGDTLHSTVEEAEKQAQFILRQREARQRSLKQLEAEQAKRIAEETERKDIDGFMAEATPLQRGKAIETLSKKVRYKGEEIRVRDLIRRKVKEGWIVTKERLEGTDGIYLKKSVIGGATGLSYANHYAQVSKKQSQEGHTEESS